MKARVALGGSAKKELRRALKDYHMQHLTELDAIILWVLHEEYGFGEARLKKFFETFNTAVNGLLERYEMAEDETDDQIWLFTHKLKEAGIDIDEWEKGV